MTTPTDSRSAGASVSHPELFLPEDKQEAFFASVCGMQLLEQTTTLITELLETQSQPGAEEVLSKIEQDIGWIGRWIFWETVRRMREDKNLQAYQRDYLTTALSDEAVRQALAGDADLKKTYRSTLDELVRRSSQYRRSDAFREMIEFTARFRDYAPYNNLLVKIQKPSCGFYATARDWNLRFNRDVKEDARPLLILAPMHPVMLVYDLDQTEGSPLPKKLTDFATTEGQFEPEWLAQLLENAERDRVLVRFQELSSTHGGFATTRLRDGSYKMRIAVHSGLNQASSFSVLCHELAHIYLGHLGSDQDGWWPSRINLSHATVEIEAEATSFIVATQLGLTPVSESYLASFITGDQIPETVSIELITKVAGKLTEMVKRKLPTRKKAPVTIASRPDPELT
jgi:hypothetical protein